MRKSGEIAERLASRGVFGPTFILCGVVHSGDDGAIGALSNELDGLVPVGEIEVDPIDL